MMNKKIKYSEIMIFTGTLPQTPHRSTLIFPSYALGKYYHIFDVFKMD